MKTKVVGSQLIENALIGVGKFNKINRANDVKTVLAAISDNSGLKVELSGSMLKIDCTHTIEAEQPFHDALSMIINGHVTRIEQTMKNDGEFRTMKIYLFVDLLQPRN